MSCQEVPNPHVPHPLRPSAVETPRAHRASRPQLAYGRPFEAGKELCARATCAETGRRAPAGQSQHGRTPGAARVERPSTVTRGVSESMSKRDTGCWRWPAAAPVLCACLWIIHVNDAKSSGLTLCPGAGWVVGCGAMGTKARLYGHKAHGLLFSPIGLTSRAEYKFNTCIIRHLHACPIGQKQSL
jgi:hypothetical protein